MHLPNVGQAESNDRTLGAAYRVPAWFFGRPRWTSMTWLEISRD